MKLAELIYNKRIKESGQSLLELIVAIGIFIVSASSLAFFIFNSYSSGSIANDFLVADLLAQEGIEAIYSIRNNNWDDLAAGVYSLVLTREGWSLESSKGEVDSHLKEAIRFVEIEDIDQDRKKVVINVFWGRGKNTSLVTYLANWQKEEMAEIKRPTRHQDLPPRQTANPGFAYDEEGVDSFSETNFGASKDPSIIFFGWGESSFSYSTLNLNIRYSVQESTGRSANDEYAFAFSLQGCGKEVEFFDMLPLTSDGAKDEVISIQLPVNQDLSLLCVKVYSRLNAPPDRRLLYINDIWTEGKAN